MGKAGLARHEESGGVPSRPARDPDGVEGRRPGAYTVQDWGPGSPIFLHIGRPIPLTPEQAIELGSLLLAAARGR